MVSRLREGLRWSRAPVVVWGGGSPADSGKQAQLSMSLAGRPQRDRRRLDCQARCNARPAGHCAGRCWDRAPMDAGDDDQIAGVVDRISNEQGRLDVLVNSVWGGYERVHRWIWNSIRVRSGAAAVVVGLDAPHRRSSALRDLRPGRALDDQLGSGPDRQRVLVRRSGVRAAGSLRCGACRHRPARS